jgi:hypothetical protein
VQAATLLFALGIAMSLGLSPAPALWWRLLAGATTAMLAWHPLRSMIFQRGPMAVRRFEWACEGSWLIVHRDGVRRPVYLHPASAAIGPWIVLVWTGRPARFARRSYALIDAARVSPAIFRALRGRLKLTGQPPAARPRS